MGIPLVALMGRPPQIRDWGEQQNLNLQNQSLQNQNALAPGQQQMQQNELQMQQMQMEQARRQQQDQQTVQAALAENNGDFEKTLPQLAGKVSLPTYQALQKAHLDHIKTLAEIDEKQLSTEKYHADQLSALGDQASKLSDEDYMNNWASIAAQADKIRPELGLDPNNPMPRQQFAASLLGLKTTAQYLDQEKARREAQKAAQETAAATAELPGKVAESTIKTQEAAMTPEQRAQLKLLGDTGALEMKDWLAKNPGKGPAEFMRYKATLVPAFNFNVSGGGSQITPDDPTVQLVASGKMKLTEALTPRTPLPVRKAFVNAVVQANPNFDTKSYDIEKGVEKAFTSGQYSQQLNSINRAREHMGTFLQLAEAMNNSDVKAINKVSNFFKEQFGSSAPANLQIAKQAFASEVGKSFAGANVALADRQELDHAIDSASSWTQFRDAAKTADTLLAGAQKALKQTYESGRQGKPNFGEASNTTTPAATTEHPFFSKFGGQVKPQ